MGDWRALWTLALRAQPGRRRLAWLCASSCQALGQLAFVGATATFAAGTTENSLLLLGVAAAGSLVRVGAQGWAAAEQARWGGLLASQLQQQVLAPPASPTNAAQSRHSDHGSSLHHQSSAVLSAQIDDVERGLSEGLLPASRAVLELLPLLALLGWVMPGTAWVIALAVAPLVLWIQRSRRHVHELMQRQQRARARALERFESAVRHDELWRVQGRGEEVRAQVVGAMAEQAQARASWALRAEWTSGQNELLGIALVWLCVALAPTPGRAGAELVRFFAVFFMAYRPLRQLLTARLAVQRGALALASLPRRPGPLTSPVSGREWPVAALTLEQLRLPFATERAWDAELPPGALGLLTGPSGVGKSSLLRALLGLVPLAGGALRYGDAPLHDAGVGPAARPFAWLPQDCPLLGATVGEVLGIAARTELSAAHAALIDDVPERSAEFSGGERQRLALLVALRSAAPVLLLDEPTAHLDRHRAEQVARLLQDERRRGRALLVVSHEPARLEPSWSTSTTEVQLRVYAAPPSDQGWAA